MKNPPRQLGQQCNQISIDDISIEIGDKLYRNSVLYAEVVDMGETLYFIKKPGETDSVLSFYIKDRLVRDLLFGNLSLQRLSFK